jgi:hypothetical protein
MNEQTKQRIDETRAKHLQPPDNYGTQHLSISSMMGKKVVDILGYVSQEYGFDSPVFCVSAVVFEDGTQERLQGEHDMVYFPADDVPGLTNLDLLLCMDPADIEEDDDDDFQEYLDDADKELAEKNKDDENEPDGFDPDDLDDENDEERRRNRY